MIITLTEKFKQLYYERTFNELKELSTDKIFVGCKVFEEHGMCANVQCNCFVHNVAGGYEKYMQNNVSMATFGLDYTFGIHFTNPEIVWLAACEILESRGEI